MSKRAEVLALQFAQTNGTFVDVVRRLSPTQWQTYRPQEERTIAALGGTSHLGTPSRLRPFAPWRKANPGGRGRGHMSCPATTRRQL